MTFESHAAYRDFWRQHPAFAHDWSPVVEGYVDYDLEGTAPRLKPSAVVAAVATDASQLFGGAEYEAAMRAVQVPTTFLRAPRGLMDEPQALYAPGRRRSAPASCCRSCATSRSTTSTTTRSCSAPAGPRPSPPPREVCSPDPPLHRPTSPTRPTSPSCQALLGGAP